MFIYFRIIFASLFIQASISIGLPVTTGKTQVNNENVGDPEVLAFGVPKSENNPDQKHPVIEELGNVAYESRNAIPDFMDAKNFHEKIKKKKLSYVPYRPTLTSDMTLMSYMLDTSFTQNGCSGDIRGAYITKANMCRNGNMLHAMSNATHAYFGNVYYSASDCSGEPYSFNYYLIPAGGCDGNTNLYSLTNSKPDISLPESQPFVYLLQSGYNDYNCYGEVNNVYATPSGCNNGQKYSLVANSNRVMYTWTYYTTSDCSNEPYSYSHNYLSINTCLSSMYYTVSNSLPTSNLPDSRSYNFLVQTNYEVSYQNCVGDHYSIGVTRANSCKSSTMYVVEANYNKVFFGILYFNNDKCTGIPTNMNYNFKPRDQCEYYGGSITSVTDSAPYYETTIQDAISYDYKVSSGYLVSDCTGGRYFAQAQRANVCRDKRSIRAIANSYKTLFAEYVYNTTDCSGAPNAAYYTFTNTGFCKYSQTFIATNSLPASDLDNGQEIAYTITSEYDQYGCLGNLRGISFTQSFVCNKGHVYTSVSNSAQIFYGVLDYATPDCVGDPLMATYSYYALTGPCIYGFKYYSASQTPPPMDGGIVNGETYNYQIKEKYEKDSCFDDISSITQISNNVCIAGRMNTTVANSTYAFNGTLFYSNSDCSGSPYYGHYDYVSLNTCDGRGKVYSESNTPVTPGFDTYSMEAYSSYEACTSGNDDGIVKVTYYNTSNVAGFVYNRCYTNIPGSYMMQCENDVVTKTIFSTLDCSGGSNQVYRITPSVSEQCLFINSTFIYDYGCSTIRPQESSCEEGTVTSGRGASGCDICAPNYYGAAGRPPCSPCPLGSQAALGSEVCVQCYGPPPCSTVTVEDLRDKLQDVREDIRSIKNSIRSIEQYIGSAGSSPNRPPMRRKHHPTMSPTTRVRNSG